ncbi:YdgA family protein [Legionella sp. CNM-4043-24]|uniref:YdgA family protein n=1 Tax=Legionella sp. CNM-4043-24 TaxID=3421646 RepID=UPI00403B3752
MKKLAGLVVILAILVLGGYYGMGVATERTVRHNLDVINQSNGVFASIDSYNRGWFSSTATLDWKLHVPERLVKSADGQSETVPAQDYSMKMPLTILHGPFIFSKSGVKFGLGYASTDLELPAQYTEQFNNLFTSESTRPKMDLSLFVNYFNSSDVEMAVPSFKLIAKQGGEFDWMGMTSNTFVTSNADKIEGGMNVTGMLFTQKDIKATLGKVETEYKLRKTDSGLYLGEASVSIPSIVVTQNGQTQFEMNSFDLNSSSDISDDLFSSHFKTSIGKIQANGKTFGPGNLEISVRNLDATVLARINEQVTKAQQGTDQEKQQALMAILPDVPKLFSRGAEFEVSDLSFTMPQGTVEGTLFVSLPKGDSANPFELITKIHGVSKLKVPVEVVQLAMNEANRQRAAAQQGAAPAADASAPAATPDVSEMTKAQIASMLQTGLIVQQGDYYVVELSLDQGKLLVNGNPFSQEMLKF